MTEKKQAILCRKSIFSNFSPLGPNLPIKFVEKVFDFLKAHIKRQLLVAMPYRDSNFSFFCIGSYSILIYSTRGIANSIFVMDSIHVFNIAACSDRLLTVQIVSTYDSMKKK